MYPGAKKFSKIEFAIIFVVLGLVGTVVMPKLSQAANQVNTSDLCDALYDVRTNITLYKVQHNNKLPGWGSASFMEAMTGVTNSDGSVYGVVDDKEGQVQWGPYLKGMPVNVFNSMNTVRIDGPAAGQGTHGWRYDSLTGEFQADDSGVGHNIL